MPTTSGAHDPEQTTFYKREGIDQVPVGIPPRHVAEALTLFL